MTEGGSLLGGTRAGAVEALHHGAVRGGRAAGEHGADLPLVPPLNGRICSALQITEREREREREREKDVSVSESEKWNGEGVMGKQHKSK